VTSCNKTGFVSSVMFDCIDHVHTYLLVLRARVATKSKVFECRKLINHKDLSVLSVGKFGVAVTLINRHCLFMVARCLETVHVDGLGAKPMKLGLFGMA